jgi:AcrR family transcriptional regulator
MAGEDRRAQLVEVAMRTFAQRSYDEVSMDDIAAEAQISKALLYQHFPAKRDLYIATLGVISEALTTAVTQVDRSHPPAERVRLVLNSYLDFITQHRSSFISLVRGGIGDDATIANIKEQVRRRTVAELLKGTPLQGIDHQAIELAARGWIGFVETSSVEWCIDPKISRDELCELLSHMLFEALKHVTLMVTRAR